MRAQRYLPTFYRALVILGTFLLFCVCLCFFITIIEWCLPLSLLPDSIILPYRRATIVSANQNHLLVKFCVDNKDQCFECTNNQTYELVKVLEPTNQLYPIYDILINFNTINTTRSLKVFVYWDPVLTPQTNQVFWAPQYLTLSPTLYYAYYIPQIASVYVLVYGFIGGVALFLFVAFIMFVWYGYELLSELIQYTWRTITS